MKNKGQDESFFGYGLHPFWRIHGERSSTFIKVPCNYIMDLVDLVPNGDITPVDGTDLDLREFSRS